MTALSDVLSAIDAHTAGCVFCGHTLACSPSDDFCGERCQQAWHAARAGLGYQPSPVWGTDAVSQAFAAMAAVVRDTSAAMETFLAAFQQEETEPFAVGREVLADAESRFYALPPVVLATGNTIRITGVS